MNDQLDKKLMTMPPELQLQELSRLTSTPGWGLYMEFMDMQISRAQAAILGTAEMTGEQLIHARATYQSLTAMRDWPVKQADMLKARIEASKRASERDRVLEGKLSEQARLKGK